MFLQNYKQLTIIILLCHTLQLHCSQQRFYFKEKDTVIGIEKWKIQKIPALQELWIYNAYQQRDLFNRSFCNINSLDNPIIVPSFTDAKNNLVILSTALEQLQNDADAYLLSLSNDKAKADALCASALHFNATHLCRLVLINTMERKSVPSEIVSLIMRGSAEKQSTLLFKNPETVARSAISPNGLCYAIAKDQSNEIELYNTSNNTLERTVLNNNFTFNKEDYPIIRFVNNDLMLFCRKLSNFYYLYDKNTKEITETNAMRTYCKPKLHPQQSKTIAHLRSDEYLINTEKKRYSMTHTSNGSQRHVLSSGIEWNATGSHVLFHIRINVCDNGCNGGSHLKYNDEICIINYNTLTQSDNNLLIQHRTHLENHQEPIFAAKWLSNDRIISLSPDHISIWNTNGDIVQKLEGATFEEKTKSQYIFKDENTKQEATRYFYPGTIALNENKKTCFIDQIRANYLIKINFDTDTDCYTAIVVTLENFTNKSNNENFIKQTLFNSDVTLLAILLDNTLLIYATDTGLCCGSIEIDQTRNTSIQFNDRGDTLFLSHDKGIDTFQVSNVKFDDYKKRSIDFYKKPLLKEKPPLQTKLPQIDLPSPKRESFFRIKEEAI